MRERESIRKRNASVQVIVHAAKALDALAVADAIALISAVQHHQGSAAPEVEAMLEAALAELIHARRYLEIALAP